MQRWPVEPNAALRTMPAASSRSASASTMVGFLPPISSCTRARRLPHTSATLPPVASDPVNEMARTCSCATSAPPASPRPCTTLSDAGRQAGLDEDLGQPRRAERRQFRGLEHHGVAADQRRAGLPRRNGDGEVPRRDRADDAERRPQRVHEHAVAFRRDDAAVQPRALAAVVPQDVDGAADFALRLGQRLAFLARHLPGDRIGAGLEQVGGLDTARRHAWAPACAAQAGWAPCAAATAAATSSADDSGNVPTRSSTSAGLRFSNVRPVTEDDPLAGDEVVIGRHAPKPNSVPPRGR